MPQNQTTNQSPTNGAPPGDYTAIDPKKDPIAFVMQNQEALSRMPPDKAVRFVDMMFRRFALPKYVKMNQQKPLDEEELEDLRLQFAARMFGLPFEKTNLKGPKVEYGTAAKVGATAAAAGAGVIGGLRTIEELRENIMKHLGPIGKAMQYDPVNMLLKKGMTPAGKVEGRAYEEAKAVTPRGADVGAAIGHQIPASIAAEGAGGLIPKLLPGAPTALKVAAGGARGAVEGGAFEASRPGGDPESGMKWGGVLGAAFPLLGRMFGLGRKAPEVAKVVEGSTTSAAGTTTEATAKSMGDVAETAAKKKFGKSFKDLTPAEKTQMPAAMKEEIKAQQAVKQANKKAEVAAAKAGREADETAKRAEKAAKATEKANQQAAKRSVSGASTPVAKQAVAAQAAAENPSIAKTVAPIEKRVAEGASPTGVERRKITTPLDVPTEGEKLAKEIRASSAKTTTVTEGEALQHIMKDASKYEAFKKLDSKDQGKMLVEAKNELEKITKVPEGTEGKKVRAKGGQPASPAQQAADRERIAAKREQAKGEEFGKALEKHAQEMAGRHTAGSVGMMHIPELEDAIKEFEGGKMVLSGLQKLRKAGRITDEIYLHEMKEWMMQQFETMPKASD